MSKTDKENLERKNKYEALVKAGFSSREANIYKDRSWDMVYILINNKAADLDKGLNLIKKVIDPLSNNDNK